MNLNVKHTRYPSIPAFPKLFLDYVSASEKLSGFYRYKPELSSFGKAIADLSSCKFNRSLLVEVLKEQNGEKECKPSIEALLDEKTFTVCTGHQLCLFGGPLFFFYKIISTINLAESLQKKYPQNRFVPVLWLAGEDHDFEEINHIHLFDKKLEWKEKPGGPVGRMKTRSLAPVLDELRTTLGDHPKTGELMGIFSEAYLRKESLADATRQLVHCLFGRYGLLVLNADDARLKKEFIPVMRDELTNRFAFRQVSGAIAELNKIGYEAQVNPREINLFFLSENVRTRIEDPSGYLPRLEREAVSFSPNVVLRTLYQQAILPNIACVGGPAEISYWLEFKKMFEHRNVFFPVLIPRNSVLWEDQRSGAQAKKLGLSAEKLFESEDAIIRDFIERNSAINLEDEKQKIADEFARLTQKAHAADPTLSAAVVAEMKNVLAAIEKLEAKIRRAEKNKHEASVNQIRKLKEKFFPEGKLQERHESFIPFYLAHGSGWLDALKKNLDPFEKTFTVITEE